MSVKGLHCFGKFWSIQDGKEKEHPPFKAERDEVYNIDVERYEKTSRPFIPQRSCRKAHGTANVHGVPKNVERESTLVSQSKDAYLGHRNGKNAPFHAVVHEDPKVVT